MFSSIIQYISANYYSEAYNRKYQTSSYTSAVCCDLQKKHYKMALILTIHPSDLESPIPECHQVCT